MIWFVIIDGNYKCQLYLKEGWREATKNAKFTASNSGKPSHHTKEHPFDIKAVKS